MLSKFWIFSLLWVILKELFLLRASGLLGMEESLLLMACSI
jgi:hypothetical protein